MGCCYGRPPWDDPVSLAVPVVEVFPLLMVYDVPVVKSGTLISSDEPPCPIPPGPPGRLPVLPPRFTDVRSSGVVNV